MGRHWLAVASVVSAAVVVVVAFVWAPVALGPSRLVVADVQFGVAVVELVAVELVAVELDLAVAELVVVAAVDQVPESVEKASAVEASAVL